MINLRRTRKKRITILQTKNKKIKEQSEELSLSNKTKDTLFSIIAHDLRSPFTSLLGFSSMLYDETKTGNYKNISTYAEQINSATINTYELVDNLLNWSKSQQKSISISPSLINLKETINEILIPLNAKADEKNIKIFVNIDPGTSVYVDKNILMVIVRNLVSNSLKFTAKNGGITINSINSVENTTINIKDTGKGISKDIIDKLFTDNSAFTTKGTDNEKGSGIGLMLVSDFVKKIGGEVWVKSIINEGSTFSFTIPSQNFNLT